MSEAKLNIDIPEELKPFILKCLTLNHELNNPLAGIVGYCEFLISEAENLSEDEILYLKRIETCADRIQKSLKKLSDDKIELDKKYDLKNLVDVLKSV